MFYRTGTLSLTNGSTAATGTGTDFINGAAVGECVQAPDGRLYEILSIQSSTALTLGTVYLGATASGQTYAIVPTSSYIRDLASQAATLVNGYAAVKDGAGSGKFTDGTVALPGIAFASDVDSGLRRTGANEVAVVTGGVDRITVSSAGAVAIPGTLTVTGAVTGPTAAAGSNTTQLATTAFVAAADALKANLASPTFTGTVGGVTKTMVGLGNVDNTTDALKPVSTATQTALNLKANLASPTLTSPTLTSPTLTTEALVVTTNNYPTARPSLNLDFANSQSVDPRITFTRASTATRVNSKGLIESVASGVPRIDFDPVTLACKGLLIEEARTNLLTYSESFDNAVWIKNKTTITPNAVIAPDGSLTAYKLLDDANTSIEHYMDYTYSVTTGATYTFSAFFKGNEKSVVRLRTAISTPDLAATFNLTTGTISSSLFSAGNYGITPVGNGWFRAWVVFTANATGNIVARTQLLQNGTEATTVYTGDGTSGLYLWGAQLEAGAFPTSYIPSTETFTGRASIGTYVNSSGLIATALSGVARYSYNPMNLTVAPKLLLEGAVTNLLTYSEQFDNAVYGKASGITVTPNTVTSPDGLTTADTITATAAQWIDANMVVTNGLLYTVSFFAKAGTASQISSVLYGAAFNSGGQNISPTFDISNGSILAATGAINTKIDPVGAGWYRCSFSVIATAATGTYSVQLARLNSAGMAYIWGAQLEAGPLSSYIPTTTAQVTRVADTSTSAATTRVADAAVMTGANFSSWYRQDESTLVVGWNAVPNSSDTNFLAFLCKTGTPEAAAIRIGYSGARRARYYGQDTAAVFQYGAEGDALGTATSGVCAMTFKSLNDFSASTNGNTTLSDVSGVITPSIYDRLVIGSSGSGFYANACIKSFRYYPSRVSNAALQALSAQ